MSIVRTGLALVTAGAIAAGAFFVYNAQAQGRGERDQIAQQLRELRQHNAVLNQDILKLRSGLYRNYDTVVVATQRMSDLVAGLNQVSTAGLGQENPQFAGLLLQFGEDFETRRAYIERFKGRNAILRNSLFYFPIVSDIAKSHADRLGGLGQLKDAIDSLQRDLLVFYIHGDAALQPRLRAHLHELSGLSDEAPSELANQLQLLVKHAAIVLAEKKAVDALVEEITSTRGVALADSLHNSYQGQRL